jgi:NAD(P)H-hydrate epimerase
MLSIAVPESIRLLLIAQLPDALVMGCPEDDTGAMAQLPDGLELEKYNAIACGCGVTLAASPVVQQILASDRPLVLDADGLNILANLGTLPTLKARTAPTILTPHWGEFQRLFPELVETNDDRITAAQQAARQSGAVVLLKGARTTIASPNGTAWLNPESTPALARGGTGDVLTGLMGGLLAQGLLRGTAIEQVVFSAAWWHAQAGVMAAKERSELGVDASTLVHYLIPAFVWAKQVADQRCHH